MLNYPSELYPTIVEGEVHGLLRCESLDGGELYLEAPNGIHRLKDFKPFEQDGKTWGVSNIQKKSKRGWLKTSPDCFYSWYTISPQKQDANGNWIPGTERVIYFRKPFSWRWDVAGTYLDGALRHFVRTKGYFGFHYD